MVESISLRDASVQDIQLELLRRTSFNALDGEKVHASLLNTGNSGWPLCSTGPGSRITPSRASCSRQD
jgi:hypothetical protein